MSIQSLIVDDEPLARQRIRRLLADENEIEVIGECANGEEAVDFIESQHPDIVFLDIQMPKLNGLSLVKRMSEPNSPLIVFITAYDEHAVKAFELNAVDYLLKPVQSARFKSTIRRVREKLDSTRSEMAKLVQAFKDISDAKQYTKQIAVKTDQGVEFIKTPQIDWIEAANNHVKLHVGREIHTIRETLSGIEQKLNPEEFARIHRSHIVNIERIDRLEPLFHGDFVLFLTNGTKLKLSRTYKPSLEKSLGAKF